MEPPPVMWLMNELLEETRRYFVRKGLLGEQLHHGASPEK